MIFTGRSRRLIKAWGSHETGNRQQGTGNSLNEEGYKELKMSEREKRNYRSVVILVFISLILHGCGGRNGAKKNGKDFKKPPIPVEVVEVTRGAISETVDVSGDIKSESEISVVSKLQAKIKTVRVKEGDNVFREQTLIVLDGADLSAQVKQAEASVLAAKARYNMALAGARPQEKKQVSENLSAAKTGFEIAKKDFERMSILHEHGSISDQQFDQTKARYEDAKARYEQLQQQLELVNEGPRQEEKDAAKAALLQAQASLQYARTLLSYTRITSPCTCSVSSKMASAGEMAAPGIPLLRLVDNGHLFFEAELSEKQSSRFKTGQSVTVTVDGVPGRNFAARVVRTYPSVDTVSRAVKVKIALENTGHLLLSGMFARGSVVVLQKQNALLVEKDSVRFSQEKPYVYVIRENKAEMRALKTGVSDSAKTEVLSGLEEGETIVLTGSPDLKDGSVVKIVEAEK